MPEPGHLAALLSTAQAMQIEIDLRSVPPTVSLREADDFGGFKVVVAKASDAQVSRAELRRLAGARADDPEWSAQLEKMIEYAESKGWVAEDGSIQAHLEWRE